VLAKDDVARIVTIKQTLMQGLDEYVAGFFHRSTTALTGDFSAESAPIRHAGTAATLRNRNQSPNVKRRRTCVS